MAKLFYKIYKNNNSHSKGYGKYYARAKSTETINLRRLASHIADHGSIYTNDVVHGVVIKMVSCIRELLLDSKKVKLDGLGTFYVTLNTKGEADSDKFTAAANVENLHIRFLPDQSGESNMKGKILKGATTLTDIAKEMLGKNETIAPKNGQSSGSGSNGDGETGRP